MANLLFIIYHCILYKGADLIKNGKILLIGEPMGLLISCEEKKLEDVRNFISSIAGAEYNVALGLTRLEHTADYITKLGTDTFGKKILNALNENNISTDNVVIDGKYSTGFMLKGKNSHGDPEICYYRKNSATSSLTIDDVKDIDINQYSALHMTGIFPPLSDNCLEVAEYLMKKAKNAGVKVFFDPNLRPQLWKSIEFMKKTLNHLAQYCDYILPGYKEGEILCGSSDPEKIAQFYLNMGISTVIVKNGADGAIGFTKDGSVTSPAAYVETIVDTVGAGDGFAVGIISGVCEGLSLKDCLIRANAIGGLQIMSQSDNEDLPDRNKLDKFISNNKAFK